MGTSQSSPGPGKDSPLVPPWADDQPQQPVPSPQPKRFAPFRKSLGEYINNRSRDNLKSALKHYAGKGSGGGGTASRKLGNVNQAGVGLFGILTGNDQVNVPSGDSYSLDDLAGQSCEVVISQITSALVSVNGDADKIRSAMNHALIEALDGIEVFDPNAITDDVIVDTMIGYVAESIFLQIVMDAGKAWNKAEDPQQELAAENDLREFIKVVVDQHMESKLGGNIRAFSSEEMLDIERQVIKGVWSEWENYQ